MSISEAKPETPLLLIEALDEPKAFGLIGEMDLSNSSWVAAELDRYATTPGDLTLDLGRLRFMDGSARHALARLASKLTGGGKLVIRNAPDSVARLLKSTTLSSIPNLAFDRRSGATIPAATERLQQEAGLMARLWGVLGLAQSLMSAADEVSFTVRQQGQLTTPVATGSDALDLDNAQYEINNGPCVWAAQEGRTEVFKVADGDESLRPFVHTASERGIDTVLSIPVLREPSKPVGALNLYSRSAEGFGTIEIPRAQILAIRSARVFDPPETA